METGSKDIGSRKVFVLLLSLSMFIFMGATTTFYTAIDKSPRMFDKNLNEIDRNVNTIAEIFAIDNLRRQNIQKAMGIMNKFNSTLNLAEKRAIAEEIHEMSIKYPNLDVDLICATITHESAKTWKPDIVSQAGAMGLMQIMPTTGAFLAEEEGIPWTTAEDVLFDPINNIRMGCRYLSSLVSDYQVDGGLAAYNGGAKRAAMWISSGKDDRILWEETRGYIPAILSLYETYRSSRGVL